MFKTRCVCAVFTLSQSSRHLFNVLTHTPLQFIHTLYCSRPQVCPLMHLCERMLLLFKVPRQNYSLISLFIAVILTADTTFPPFIIYLDLFRRSKQTNLPFIIFLVYQTTKYFSHGKSVFQKDLDIFFSVVLSLLLQHISLPSSCSHSRPAHSDGTFPFCTFAGPRFDWTPLGLGHFQNSLSTTAGTTQSGWSQSEAAQKSLYSYVLAPYSYPSSHSLPVTTGCFFQSVAGTLLMQEFRLEWHQVSPPNGKACELRRAKLTESSL